LCLYEAPDAESVRRVQAKVQVPFDRAWPALAIPFADAEPREGVVVVERALDPPLDERAIRAAAEGDTCRPQWGGRVVGTSLSAEPTARRTVAAACACTRRRTRSRSGKSSGSAHFRTNGPGHPPFTRLQPVPEPV